MFLGKTSSPNNLGLQRHSRGGHGRFCRFAVGSIVTRGMVPSPAHAHGGTKGAASMLQRGLGSGHGAVWSTFTLSRDTSTLE